MMMVVTMIFMHLYLLVFCCLFTIYSIQQFLEREQIDLDKDLISDTIHCKPGGAEALIETLYTLFTNRPYVGFVSNEFIIVIIIYDCFFLLIYLIVLIIVNNIRINLIIYFMHQLKFDLIKKKKLAYQCDNHHRARRSSSLQETLSVLSPSPPNYTRETTSVVCMYWWLYLWC